MQSPIICLPAVLPGVSSQVFGPDSKQERVCGQGEFVPIVQEVLDGFTIAPYLPMAKQVIQPKLLLWRVSLLFCV